MNIIEQITIFASIAVAGYLIGSVPFGFIIGKLKGIDIRTVGSGNIGATNVTRAVSPLAGKICFALDFCKGLLPVLILKLLVAKGIIAAPAWGAGELFMIFSVVMGHMFTCFLGFKGGKGIATAVGGVAAVAPLPALAAFLTWLVIFKVSGYVSLGSILGAIALPVWTVVLAWLKVAAFPGWAVVIFFFLLAVVAVWTHRSNIKRLCNGTENSFKK
ncbi:MAG: glycerol-3-phosphate 1-O-acyltransferase PlsY [Lentisphaerae bacterium]|nr:glycerol-3-phosphate 1-O-acyltransferase PlsY [Lentisphaerota bacterium]